MYSDEATTFLTNRIAFSGSLNPEFPVELSEENSTGSSGRNFKSFHQLVTIDNIYAAVSQIDMESEPFNEYLKELKKQCVLEVMPMIFDSHEDYISTFDYSETITLRAELLDEAIGYTMACKVIELLITTQRINPEERANKLSYSALKIELDGVRNDKGFLVSKGVVLKANNAIKNAANVIFPFKVVVKSKKIW